MKRLLPDTVASRTLLVLIIGLTVSHVLSVALYFTDRASALMLTGGQHISERIATVARLVETAGPAERARIIELADNQKLHVAWSARSAIEHQAVDDWQMSVLRQALLAHLSDGAARVFRLRHSGAISSDDPDARPRGAAGPSLTGETLFASIQLKDGSWLNFASPMESIEPFWSLRFALSILVMVAAVVILSAIVVTHLTKPLGDLARAARRLGSDVRAPALREHGPSEVRQVIRAFNEMQRRLRRFVEDRTQMLAAISHDLGTPITRLRLRAEFVDDEEQKEKMLRDLDDMEKMVGTALSFARSETVNEQRAAVDLRSLLQRVCDDMEDSGHQIEADLGDSATPYLCRPTALRRAVADLVDNALKYGGQAHVCLKTDDRHVRIVIDDNGPGIPEDLQEEAFRPFRRLEASRNRETGGTGLGLAIARSIVRAHGGEITLSNRPKGGLCVEVRLPR